MAERTYSIGELARLSGVSVRRIRFYADRGLLPPATRTLAGYRVFTDLDVAKLHLIGALRAAGTGLATISQILAKRRSLADVLTLRLRALEAEIASRRRVAAVMRAALSSPHPSEDALGRLWTMSQFSNARMKATIETFYERAVGELAVDENWKRRMIEAATPELPDEPTPPQIDAWNEIMAMLTDESFIAAMREQAPRMWDESFDAAAYAEAANETLAEVRDAMAAGSSPTSPRGTAIATAWLERSARAMRREPDEAFLAWHLEHYRQNFARSSRYQELLAILRGTDGTEGQASEWHWIHLAMGPLLTPRA